MNFIIIIFWGGLFCSFFFIFSRIVASSIRERDMTPTLSKIETYSLLLHLCKKHKACILRDERGNFGMEFHIGTNKGAFHYSFDPLDKEPPPVDAYIRHFATHTAHCMKSQENNNPVIVVPLVTIHSDDFRDDNINDHVQILILRKSSTTTFSQQQQWTLDHLGLQGHIYKDDFDVEKENRIITLIQWFAFYVSTETNVVVDYRNPFSLCIPPSLFTPTFSRIMDCPLLQNKTVSTRNHISLLFAAKALQVPSDTPSSDLYNFIIQWESERPSLNALEFIMTKKEASDWKHREPHTTTVLFGELDNDSNHVDSRSPIQFLRTQIINKFYTSNPNVFTWPHSIFFLEMMMFFYVLRPQTTIRCSYAFDGKQAIHDETYIQHICEHIVANCNIHGVLPIPFRFQTYAESMHANLLVLRPKKQPSSSLPYASSSDSLHHASFLQWDLEHFEPHGRRFHAEETYHPSRQSVNDMLDQFARHLQQQLQMKFPSHTVSVRRIFSDAVCPLLGLQEKNLQNKHGSFDDGSCVLWSAFVMHLVISFPEYSTHDIYIALSSLLADKNIIVNVLSGYLEFAERAMKWMFRTHGIQYKNKTSSSSSSALDFIEYARKNKLQKQIKNVLFDDISFFQNVKSIQQDNRKRKRNITHPKKSASSPSPSPSPSKKRGGTKRKLLLALRKTKKKTIK